MEILHLCDAKGYLYIYVSLSSIKVMSQLQQQM